MDTGWRLGARRLGCAWRCARTQVLGIDGPAGAAQRPARRAAFWYRSPRPGRGWPQRTDPGGLRWATVMPPDTARASTADELPVAGQSNRW